jgi:hypothetical protein
MGGGVDVAGAHPLPPSLLLNMPLRGIALFIFLEGLSAAASSKITPAFRALSNFSTTQTHISQYQGLAKHKAGLHLNYLPIPPDVFLVLLSFFLLPLRC